MKANGLKAEELNINEAAVREIVRYYTRESGVRNLEREISKICRKVVKEIALAGPQIEKKGKRKSGAMQVTPKNIDHFLGVRRYDFGRAEEAAEIGLVTGLAWPEVGGVLLQIEASLVPGKGKLMHTGQLGDVMQESIKAALSVVRARAERLGLDADFHQKHDIHVHVPEGATPKDGPSAGIAMCTALISVLAKVAVRSDVAMTGEITLRGRVLPIGGLKEKLLAALRGGIKTVIIPERTRRPCGYPQERDAGIEIIPVRWTTRCSYRARPSSAAARAGRCQACRGTDRQRNAGDGIWNLGAASTLIVDVKLDVAWSVCSARAGCAKRAKTQALRGNSCCVAEIALV